MFLAYLNDPLYFGFQGMDLREYAHYIESELDIVGQDHEDDCKRNRRYSPGH